MSAFMTFSLCCPDGPRTEMVRYAALAPCLKGCPALIMSLSATILNSSSFQMSFPANQINYYPSGPSGLLYMSSFGQKLHSADQSGQKLQSADQSGNPAYASKRQTSLVMSGRTSSIFLENCIVTIPKNKCKLHSYTVQKYSYPSPPVPPPLLRDF